MVVEREHVPHGEHLDALRGRRLGRVGLGQKNLLISQVARRNRHRQRAGDVLDLAGERKLACEAFAAVVDAFGRVGVDERKQDRQIEGRPLLAHVRRREIDGEDSVVQRQPGRARCGANPPGRFLHGRVGQSDDVQPRTGRADAGRLHDDGDAVDAVERHGADDLDHNAFPSQFSVSYYIPIL